MSKQDINIVREFNRWRQGNELSADYPTRLSYALDEVLKGAARYEFVRTLHAHEFQIIIDKNIAGEGKFDDLVDEAMKPKEWKCDQTA